MQVFQLCPSDCAPPPCPGKRRPFNYVLFVGFMGVSGVNEWFVPLGLSVVCFRAFRGRASLLCSFYLWVSAS